MALVLANGAAALVQNAWLFGCFAVVAAFATGMLHVAHAGMYAVALLVPAVVWGALLNSLLMFSRDSAFLYTLLDDPCGSSRACGCRAVPRVLRPRRRAAARGRGARAAHGKPPALLSALLSPLLSPAGFTGPWSGRR